MNRFILFCLLAVIPYFTFQQNSLAQCIQTGNTPGGGNIIDCPGPVQDTNLNTGSNPGTTDLDDDVNVPEGGGLNVPGGRTINTADGNDEVTTSGTVVTNGNSASIFTGPGNDTVTVNGGLIEGNSGGMELSSGDDNVTVNAGTIRNPDGTAGEVIDTGSGSHIITINGGILGPPGGSDEIIQAGNGTDIVTLNGGVYIKAGDEVIDLVSGDDTLTFGGNIDLGGFVNCGNGFDTIEFAMDVPVERLPIISSEIAAAGLPAGSITINGIFYEWEECELLVNELNGVQNIKPIPTLSEWGMIAMAGIIGIVGVLFVIRRRSALNTNL